MVFGLPAISSNVRDLGITAALGIFNPFKPGSAPTPLYNSRAGEESHQIRKQVGKISLNAKKRAVQENVRSTVAAMKVRAYAYGGVPSYALNTYVGRVERQGQEMMTQMDIAFNASVYNDSMNALSDNYNQINSLNAELYRTREAHRSTLSSTFMNLMPSFIKSIF